MLTIMYLRKGCEGTVRKRFDLAKLPVIGFYFLRERKVNTTQNQCAYALHASARAGRLVPLEGGHVVYNCKGSVCVPIERYHLPAGAETTPGCCHDIPTCDGAIIIAKGAAEAAFAGPKATC